MNVLPVPAVNARLPTVPPVPAAVLYAVANTDPDPIAISSPNWFLTANAIEVEPL